MVYTISAKTEGQKTYKVLDVGAGIQVSKLFYATMFDKEEAYRVCKLLQEKNPAIKFRVDKRGQYE